MSFLFPLLLILIFALCVAFTLREGMWSNAVRLVNLVTAGLIAMNFFEPVAKLLEEQVESSLTYFWDFVAMWVLFCLSLLILRLLTDTISRVKVRFLNAADRWGGIILAVLCAWFMVCFTTASLHTAPLARDFLYGGFKLPPERNLLGLAPDWQWLGFVQYISKGVYSRGLSDGEMRDGRYGPGELAVFDQEGKFIPTYAKRRSELGELAASGSVRATGAVPKR